ncbi:hypothetical protein [Emcibacter sp.]|uniref:hypothetical protein n=1 Tax=Emcibacter sp. TaxID=1979954 RepID=UPI003A8FBBEF
MTETQLTNQSIISSLIETTRELTSVIRQEIALLKDKRPAEIQPLNEVKNRLMDSYRQHMEALNRNGGFKAAGNGEIVRQFKKENETFRDVLKQHKSTLYALKTISESMIKAIGEEVARQASQSSGYGANAQMQSAKGSKTPTTLTLNKTI